MDYGIRQNYTEVEYHEYKDYLHNGVHRLPIPQLTTKNMLQTRILKQLNTFEIHSTSFRYVLIRVNLFPEIDIICLLAFCATRKHQVCSV
jgi:hypothetical protein